MAQTLPRQLHEAPLGADARRPAGRGVLIALALLAGALFAGAVLLWQAHGAAVFFDILNAGIATCL